MSALDGIRVLDLTRLLPGGFCSQMLADFGADVIKVEDTGGGDYIRWAPPFEGGVEPDAGGTNSGLFLSLNRGKRSIRLDLKQEPGRRAFLRLVERADVLLEGFRPGVMERLGLGHESLAERNPRLVYCAITGYGQDGPNRDRAGHDLNYIGLAGLLGMTGRPDGPPIQPAAQIGDVGGGALGAAFGIMAALLERERSGRGQLVDISMADGALSWLAMVAGRHFADGSVPGRGDLELAGSLLCYLPYEARDGWVTCGALEPKFWRAFCEGVDRPDLIDKQFESPGGDAWRQVADVFASRSREEWRAFNDEHDCCIEPVLDLGEAVGSEQARERGMITGWEQPGVGPVRQLGNPVRLSRTPSRPPEPAPALGEHTVSVLAEAGLERSEIEALLESGAAAGVGGDPAEIRF